MSEIKKSPIARIASVLESAQFNNGSLDITLQGPESGTLGSPLKVVVYLQGEGVKSLSAEVSGVAVALQNIADAIKGVQK